MSNTTQDHPVSRESLVQESESLFHRILVPLDGTEHSERALPLATEFARRSGAELIVLNVTPDLADDQPTIDLSNDEEDHTHADLGAVQTEYLFGLRETLQERVSRLRVLLAGGDPVEQILQIGDDYEADLIVMATHGRAGLSRGFLGSVTDATISNAHVPILAVRGEAAPQGRYMRVEVVYVALDGSELADTSIPVAMSLAKEFGARLNLVRVIESDRQSVEVTLAQIHLEQHRVSLSEGNEGIEVQTSLLRGSPANELMMLGLTATDAVMAITTRGNRGLTRMVRGSVADHLICESSIPVLVQTPAGTSRLGASIH
ncbi:MAG: universal stress protein [Chloroflexi bacterium]|nr:universal stress protein [Chloroflexota bacterium]